jgi:hypothetical protein
MYLEFAFLFDGVAHHQSNLTIYVKIFVVGSGFDGFSLAPNKSVISICSCF